MNIHSRYSHMGGEGILINRRPHLLKEAREVIAEVDAEACRTKRSREKRKRGRMLYSPTAMNQAFRAGFSTRGWEPAKASFWVIHNEKLLRAVHSRPSGKQKQAIEEAGHEPISS